MRLVLVAIAGVLALAPNALADSRTEAKAHIERATTLHDQGRFAEALEELKTAYALEPRPELLFAMGQLHVNLGQCKEAITYYQRYLSTRPDAETARITREAIDACKHDPPPAETSTTPARAAAPASVPGAAVAAAPREPRDAPWYRDHIADGLFAGGLLAGVASIAFYGSAVSTRARADAAATYDDFGRLVDRAHGQRTTAIVLGGLGAACAIGGALHLVLSGRGHDVAVAPTAGGAELTWSGRF